MKTRVYLRIGKMGKNKDNYKVVASKTPVRESLGNGSKYKPVFYPTILMALNLEIDDKEFDACKILLEAKIKSPEFAIQIKQVELPKNVTP